MKLKRVNPDVDVAAIQLRKIHGSPAWKNVVSDLVSESVRAVRQSRKKVLQHADTIKCPRHHPSVKAAADDNETLMEIHIFLRSGWFLQLSYRSWTAQPLKTRYKGRIQMLHRG